MIRKKPITPEAARLRMADLCARAEHCSFEITEKLKRMNLPYTQIREIISFLEENKFISDQRFATAYARDKVRFSAWGRNKIRMGLYAKRIDNASIRAALDAIEEKDYMDAARRAAAVKAKSLNIADYQDRAKLFRHLAAKGFEAPVISSIISRLKSDG
ncbi:MAG: RecX family transcriptional regulator [Bacteroidales bacterium]|nr:RecX family transcriptional regulator [Bacteroidales bacterium]